MKKLLVFLICFLGMVFMNCYHEVNSDVTIKIDNNSSLDLHISFFPNTFTKDKVGVTYKYNDVNVKKGESVSLIVKFRYKEKSFGYTESAYIGPLSNDIQKIIFSKMDTGELIKEEDNIGEIILSGGGFKLYFLEITDELLTE